MFATDATRVTTVLLVQPGMIPKSSSAIIPDAEEQPSKIVNGGLVTIGNGIAVEDPEYLLWRVRGVHLLVLLQWCCSAFKCSPRFNIAGRASLHLAALQCVFGACEWQAGGCVP